MEVSSATTQQGSGTQTKQQGAAVTSDYQTFLLMLTTQMQNQDPLNPIESSDYAAQLATFSGVEQQVKTNTLLESLAAQLGLSGMAEMAGWVGMEARSTAPVAFDGAPVTLYPAPAAGAEQTVLVALNAEGEEVSRQAIPVSDEPVAWAGTDADGDPLPSGSYSFRLENYVDGELAGTTGVEAYGRVTEVQSSVSGAVIVLRGGATVAASAITALRNPASG